MADNTGRETNTSTVDASASGTIVKQPEGKITPMVSTNHSEKPEKFHGLNFKTWQQKMLFYLTTLNLSRFLSEDAPKLPEGLTDAQAVNAIDAWKHSDFLCRNYVMNCLHDSLYNVYQIHKTAKAL